MKYNLRTNTDGSALLTVIIVLPILITITLSYMSLSVTSLRLAVFDKMRTHAQFAVDAGVDIAAQEINNDPSWAGSQDEFGTLGEIEVMNQDNVRTTYESVVTNINDNRKLVTVVGRTYNPSVDTTPTTSITINAELRAVRAGDFSIVTGVGGLFLSNSARILGGDVLVNGVIEMSNTAQIGLSNNPVEVNVAHQNCPNPPDATYPRLCGSGENGQPISISNSAFIYGNVRANNQTNTNGISNLVASSGVTPQLLPGHDRAAQTSAVTTTRTGSSASCTSVNGTRTWAANTRITGNVEIDKNCRITIMGDVWIEGNLTLGNSGQIIVSDSLGATRPNIMVDGKDTKLRNTSQITSNNVSTGVQVISYWSSSACSPNCSNVTGVDLFNSSDEITIELDNSAAGPNSIFYSKWSRVLISNSGQIGALIGQTVELRNNSAITFGTSVGVGDTFWVLDGYRRSF